MMASDVARARHMESTKAAVSKSFREYFLSSPADSRPWFHAIDLSRTAGAAALGGSACGFLPSAIRRVHH
jgi:hypothetical protein